MTYSLTKSSSNFGVGLKVQFQDDGCESSPCSIKAQVDHIRITVYYTASGSEGVQTVLTDHLGGTNVVTNAAIANRLILYNEYDET